MDCRVSVFDQSEKHLEGIGEAAESRYHSSVGKRYGVKANSARGGTSEDWSDTRGIGIADKKSNCL